jgi:hypothetical protein
MHELLGASVPVARFALDRALEANNLETPEGRDRALQVVAPIIGRVGPGLLQDDLIRVAADRLQMTEAVTHEALRRVARPGAGRNGSGARAGPPRMLTSVDLREDTERAFLARCLAVKEAGRAALEAMDVDETFGNDLTRRAAHYLLEHLEHPGQNLPPGADDLARLIAELVIRAGELAADPAALQLERLQLDKVRLDRRIADARRAGEPVTALAVERQRIQDEIRHRLV